MRGTQVRRNASDDVSPPGCPFAQVVPAAPVPAPSCPSLHRFGVMNTRFGVVRACARSRGQVPEVDHIGVAGSRVDDRVEVHERVMARGIGIAQRHRAARCLGRVGEVGPDTDQRMAASRTLARRIVAHVLHVAAPGQAHLSHLVHQRLDAGGVDAPACRHHLALRRPPGLGHVVEIAPVFPMSPGTQSSAVSWVGAWPLIMAM